MGLLDIVKSLESATTLSDDFQHPLRHFVLLLHVFLKFMQTVYLTNIIKLVLFLIHSLVTKMFLESP